VRVRSHPNARRAPLPPPSALAGATQPLLPPTLLLSSLPALRWGPAPAAHTAVRAADMQAAAQAQALCTLWRGLPVALLQPSLLESVCPPAGAEEALR
jgi:hypothetical protein